MSDEIFLSHLAKVRLLEEDAVAEFRNFLREKGYAGDVGDDSLFFWRAEISNTLLDSHFTHMNEKTLRNYAEDSDVGVSFLRGHRRNDLAIGYSFRGILEEEVGRRRVVADFYTIRGLAETDDLIKRMQAGLVRDVSIGFYGGEYWCDICRQTFWDCMHWPGMKYEIKDGDSTKTVVATYEIDDARLSEVSGVFDGSTPSAMVLKAQRMAAAGLIDNKQIEILEQRYRIKLPSPPRTFTVTNQQRTLTYKQKEEETMPMDEKQFSRVSEILVNAKLLPADQRETVDAETAVVLIDKLATRVLALELQAEDGRKYREDLVATAMTEGTRAYGNDFNAEKYKRLLASAPLEDIMSVTADFKKVADVVLPSGRSTVDDDQTPEKGKVQNEQNYAPDSVFA